MREYFEIASPMDLIEYKRLLETEASQLPDALLVKDIDMTGVPWEPITVGKDKLCSWDFDPFSKSPAAVLDGNGHIITGLRYCPAVKLLKTIVVTLAEGKYTSVQPIGTLFNTSGNINMRSLALRGELFCSGEYRDKEIKQGFTVTGGLTGHSAPGGKIENCDIDVDINYDQRRYDISSSVAGIVGTLEGKMESCRYRGGITGSLGYGLAYMNTGLIVDSYGVSPSGKYYPNVPRAFNESLVDNIRLYAPGGVHYSNDLKDLFSSTMIWELLRAEALSGKSVKDCYWANVAVHKIARTVEECCRSGCTFGEGGRGEAVSCSLLPLNYCSCKTIKQANRFASLYGVMLEALVKESPSFRRELLEDAEEDYNKTVDRLWGYMTSKKRAVRVLNTARKYEDYCSAVEADNEYAEVVYMR